PRRDPRADRSRLRQLASDALGAAEATVAAPTSGHAALPRVRLRYQPDAWGFHGPLAIGDALPAASFAWSNHDVTGAPMEGKVKVPAGSAALTGCPLIVPDTVAGSLSWNCNAGPFTTANAGATVSTAKGT